MDLVYQHTLASIGLLDVTITTQEEMDILDSMLRLDELSAQQFLGSLHLLERVSNDEWMSRAWVYQEVAAAGSRMVLFLKCDPSLHLTFQYTADHLTSSLNILGEYCILPGEVIHAIKHLENCPILSGHSISKQVQSRLDKASNLIKSALSGESHLLGRLIGNFQKPMPWEERKQDIYDPLYRPLVYIVEALQGLEGRSNSRIPDRIAMLGNLFGFSMSANVFALALLNGDLTLLSALNGTQPGRNCEGLQWFPLSKSIRNCSLASQDPSDRISYQLDTHVFSKRGLGTEGNIWEMTEKIDLWSLVNPLEFPESQWNKMLSICLRAETSNGNMDAALREDIDELAIWATWSVI
ncbi:hypothetical protein BOTNAR_0160g00150 [Botryotinia narcissicola]|uniref:Heterokaryon incompatibility domain-containing protein n=1 Tax=Botryotinia narcissicola TaxID=278944 RepID=A0A4Z1ID21_9HELO|nr:hypothetical protein BOTNAR_0160g00150 [Botryotinia narcissicola]